MHLALVEDDDPVVGGDVARGDDIGVTIWAFIGSVWLFELSGVCGGFSVLVG